MMSHAGFLEHALLGRVTVNVRRDSRRISARWRKGAVSLNVPSGAFIILVLVLFFLIVKAIKAVLKR